MQASPARAPLSEGPSGNAAGADSTAPAAGGKDQSTTLGLLVKAIQGGVVETRRFFRQANYKASDLSEAVAAISTDHARKLFRSILAIINAIKAELQEVANNGGVVPPSTASSAENGQEGADDYVEDVGEYVNIRCAILTQTANVLYAWIDSDAEGHAVNDAFQQTTLELGALVGFVSHDKVGLALRSSILRLSERYFVQNRPGKDHVIANTLPDMLRDATNPPSTSASAASASASAAGPTDASIKRLYACREAFTLFDYADEESASLKANLLSCFVSPAVFRTADNRRLLAYLLAHVPDLTEEIHATIRDKGIVDPATNAARLFHYGELYLKAWTMADEHGPAATEMMMMVGGDAALGEDGAPIQAPVGAKTTRASIERICLQDLLHRCIHSAFPDVFKATRRVLSEVWEEGRRTATKGVDGMLVRVFEPILFRALKAANGFVRKNAAVLFFEVFPLKDAEMSRVELNELLQQQFNQLVLLLADESPAVRECAVHGVATVLRGFWSVIPAASREKLLERLVYDCTTDSRAPQVRAAVPAALCSLVDGGSSNAAAILQALKKPLAEVAGTLLFDKSDKVRLAAAAMIKKLTTSLKASAGAWSLFELVEKDSLLARLTLEDAESGGGGSANTAGKNSIVSILVSLLAPEFFPKDQPGRILTMLKEHEAATFVFLTHAHRAGGVTVSTLSKAVLELKAAVQQQATPGQAEIGAAAGAGAAEEQGEEDEEEDEDAGFRKKGKRAAAAAAKKKTATAKPAPKKEAGVKRGRDGQAKAAASGSSSSSSSSSSPSRPSVAVLLRAIALIWETIAGPLKLHEEESKRINNSSSDDDDEDAEGSTAEKPAAAGADESEGEDDEGKKKASKASKKGKNKGGASASNDAVRAQLLEAFSGDRLQSMLDSFKAMAVGASSGAAASSSSFSDDDLHSVTQSLLRIGEHLPSSSASSLADLLWTRLRKIATTTDSSDFGGSSSSSSGGAGGGLPCMSPADAAALPHLLQCLCSWGKAEAVLDAAARSIKGAGERLARGEPLLAASASSASAAGGDGGAAATTMTMDPFVAVVTIGHVGALLSSSGSSVATPGATAKMTEAMLMLRVILGFVQRMLSAGCSQTSTSLLNSNTAALAARQLQLLSLSCLRVWKSLVLQQMVQAVPAITASAGVTSGASQLTAGAAFLEGQLSGVVGFVCGPLLKSVLHFITLVESRAGAFADAAVISRLAPLEVACRGIVSELCLLCADAVVMEMAVPSTFTLLREVTSVDPVTLSGQETSSFTPVEWLGNVEQLLSYYASPPSSPSSASSASSAFQPLPMEVAVSYCAALRLASCLQSWSFSSLATSMLTGPVADAAYLLHAPSLTADQRSVLNHGLSRLLLLAPLSGGLKHAQKQLALHLHAATGKKKAAGASAEEEDDDEESEAEDEDEDEISPAVKVVDSTLRSVVTTMKAAATPDAATAAAASSSASMARSFAVAFLSDILSNTEVQVDTLRPEFVAFLSQRGAAAAAAVALGPVEAAIVRACAASAPAEVAYALSSRAQGLFSSCRREGEGSDAVFDLESCVGCLAIIKAAMEAAPSSSSVGAGSKGGRRASSSFIAKAAEESKKAVAEAKAVLSAVLGRVNGMPDSNGAAALKGALAVIREAESDAEDEA